MKKTRKRKSFIVYAALSALLALWFSGCASSGRADFARKSAAPVSSAEPAPSPNDKSELVAREALEKARLNRVSHAGEYLARRFRENLAVDASALVAEMELLSAEKRGIAAAAARRDMALEACAAVSAAAKDALALSLGELATYLPVMGDKGEVKLRIDLEVDEPDWRVMLCFARACVSTMRAQACADLLARAMTIEAGVVYDKDENALEGTLYVGVPAFPELWRSVSPEPQEYIAGSTGYAYFSTVYDDEGRMRDYEEPEGAYEAMKDIASPLHGGVIRKTWYAPRDGGSRVHTGTDVLAPEDTPIYSCTDGEVICVSEGLGAGNFVVVRDDLGYEYHYYHMVRLSTFLTVGQRVQKGGFIGSVGNTGNSDTNHLHLSVVVPDGRYVNPYDYLVEAEKRRLGE